MGKDIFKLIRELTKDISKKEKEKIISEERFRVNIAIAMVSVRKELGISQKELAKKLGVTQSWISKLENANNDHQIESIYKYLKALGADLKITINYSKKRKSYMIVVSSAGLVSNEDESSYEINTMGTNRNIISKTRIRSYGVA